MRPEGVEIGGLINRSNSESTTFTAARLNVDGDLDVDVGRDLGLLGARVHAGGDADIDVANNLTIKTLQDISESSNFSAGLSVTIRPNGPTGGSANFAAGNSESLRSNAIAGITTTEALAIDVGGTTTVTGGIIGSESGALDLTTTNLVLNDLTERERSRQTSRNSSFGNTSTDNGGSEFGVTGKGGSFSSAALDGTTRAS